MSTYPIPSYAASAWIAGDKLWLAFPPLDQNEQGHSVPFSIDLPLLRSLSAEPGFGRGLRGIVLALEALKARNDNSTVGTKGSPTRVEIERATQNSEFYKAWVGANEKKKVVDQAEKAEAEAFLKELGL